MVDLQWYYGVVAVAALEVVGFGIVAVTQFDAVPLATGLVGAVLVVASFLLLPVFGLCLYLDASAVRESGESWDPNPALWALGGTGLQLVALTGGGTSLYTLVAVWYLFRRFQSSPAAVADEEAWAEQEAQWDE